LVYFLVIWYILPFWYIVSRKSGNPDFNIGEKAIHFGDVTHLADSVVGSDADNLNESVSCADGFSVDGRNKDSAARST
jgi:hypothetical protein